MHRLFAAHVEQFSVTALAIHLGQFIPAGVLHLDHSVALWFHERLTPPSARILMGMSEPGSAAWIGTVLAVGTLILLHKRNWRALVRMNLMIPSGMLLGETLKLVVHRHRPYVVGPFVDWSGFSFPSGHTIGATLLYGAVLLALIPRVKLWRWRIMAASLGCALIACVAFSRVALGAHYVSDVIAAMLLGIVWLAISRSWSVAYLRCRNGARLRQTIPSIPSYPPLATSLPPPRDSQRARTTHRFPVFISLLGLGGLALLIFLLRKRGIGDVWSALHAVGWGMAAVAAFHIVPLFLDALAWWALFPKRDRLPLLRLFWMRWMGEAVSTLLPAAQVGGDIVRARLAVLRGAPAAVSAATVVGDLTLSIFTQIIFTVTGLALLVHVTHGAIGVGAVIGGAILGTLMVGGFYVAQRLGIFRRLAKLASRMASSAAWKTLVHSAEELDAQLLAMYARQRALIASAGWTLSSWVVGAGEVWIALHFLGIHRGFIDALILESVGQGIRAAVFLVPGALGVQEGGYLVVGGMLGIPGDIALALALIRRVRELAFGIPGLIGWQFVEGYRAWQARCDE